MSFKDYLRIFNNAWKSAMFGGEDFSLTEKAHKEIEEYFNKIDEDSNLSKFSANFCYVLGSFAGMVNSFYVLAWFGVYKTDSERKIKEREEFLKTWHRKGINFFLPIL